MIELMIVIAIIGLLSVVLVPKIGRSKDAAKNAGVEANMKTAMSEISQIVDNYTDPVKFQADIIKRLNNVMTNPYNAATAALDWGQWNNANAAVKTYYPGTQTDAQQDVHFSTDGHKQVRTSCAGMVVIGITFDGNRKVGAAIYGYDGAGNPFTPASKALRIGR